MKTCLTSLPILVACAATTLFLPVVNAEVLVHIVENNPSSTDASIVPASSLPSADFLSPNINFQTNFSPATPVTTFLNNPSFFNEANGFNPNGQTDNLFLEIVAQTYLTAGLNSFVLGHDDGVVLTFTDPSIGTVVNSPGPTSFSNTPFSVTAASSGLYSFDLKYGECCGGSAGLVFTINSAPVGVLTPEPSSFALFGAGLGTLAVLYRRCRQK